MSEYKKCPLKNIAFAIKWDKLAAEKPEQKKGSLEIKNLQRNKKAATNFTNTSEGFSQKFNPWSFIELKVTDDYYKVLLDYANREDKIPKKLPTRTFSYHN